MREGGGGVSARIAMAATREIVMNCDKHKLTEFRGHVQINTFWAHSLLKRMEFVKRKTTSKSKHTPEDFSRLKRSFLADVVTPVAMEEIPPELVLNWDQTGISCATWTMEHRGSQRVEMMGVNDKRKLQLCSVVH